MKIVKTKTIPAVPIGPRKFGNDSIKLVAGATISTGTGLVTVATVAAESLFDCPLALRPVTGAGVVAGVVAFKSVLISCTACAALLNVCGRLLRMDSILSLIFVRYSGQWVVASTSWFVTAQPTEPIAPTATSTITS